MKVVMSLTKENIPKTKRVTPVNNNNNNNNKVTVIPTIIGILGIVIK